MPMPISESIMLVATSTTKDEKVIARSDSDEAISRLETASLRSQSHFRNNSQYSLTYNHMVLNMTPWI